MTPRFTLKEIAFQAGVSLASVDRVVNDRPGVHLKTRARVEAALLELERMYAGAQHLGRRMAIDIVIEAPRRFTDAVRYAFETELPGIRPATLSTRFHVAEVMPPEDLAAILTTIRKRGSDGVVLKARSTPATVKLAHGLMEAGIAVVTLVTDLAESCRIGYVGIDNRIAGANAAYLLGTMGAGPAQVLLSLSRQSFAGEDDRERGFRHVIGARFPLLSAVSVAEGGGIDQGTYDRVSQALAAHPGIDRVYSIGGANRAILQAFEDARRPCHGFIAHDLDSTNRGLLAKGALSFVIHHDLRQDARQACQMLLRHHRMLPADFRIAPSQMILLTPYDDLQRL